MGRNKLLVMQASCLDVVRRRATLLRSRAGRMKRENDKKPHKPIEFDKQAILPHQQEEYRGREITVTRVHDISGVFIKGKINNILPLAPTRLVNEMHNFGNA